MRTLAAVLLLIFTTSAQAQQLLPGVPGTMSSPPTTMSLPTGSPIGEREMILMLIAERDRQYDQRFRAQELAVGNALTAAKEAVTKAEMASEKRFDSVNEFRNSLKDQQQTLATKAEVDVRFRFAEDAIKTLQDSRLKAAGSTEGMTNLWAILFGACSLGIAGIALYRSKKSAA